MVIKLPRSRESTPVAVTPPSTTLVSVMSTGRVLEVLGERSLRAC